MAAILSGIFRMWSVLACPSTACAHTATASWETWPDASNSHPPRSLLLTVRRRVVAEEEASRKGNFCMQHAATSFESEPTLAGSPRLDEAEPIALHDLGNSLPSGSHCGPHLLPKVRLQLPGPHIAAAPALHGVDPAPFAAGPAHEACGPGRAAAAWPGLGALEGALRLLRCPRSAGDGADCAECKHAVGFGCGGVRVRQRSFPAPSYAGRLPGRGHARARKLPPLRPMSSHCIHGRCDDASTPEGRGSAAARCLWWHGCFQATRSALALCRSRICIPQMRSLSRRTPGRNRVALQETFCRTPRCRRGCVPPCNAGCSCFWIRCTRATTRAIHRSL